MKIAAFVVAALAGAAVANETVSYDATFNITRTNWSSNLVIPKFDPALGNLVRVSWTLGGSVNGSASFESLDAADAMITTALAATITMYRPDNSVLDVVIPVVNNTDSATAFDGVIDFGGTSGKAYTNLSGSDNVSDDTIAAADLALFTAGFNGETISLPVGAVGSSSGSGAGNLILSFQTFAGADLKVVYEYELVPAPSALALMGLGGLVAGRRRR
ncbi:MAG: PEP-CTERM sorting domain-containing protein [Planctomycetota bacterium]|nr:PEP-CTERM sorting domain-containing protein [Planctomycetota bacterium]